MLELPRRISLHDQLVTLLCEGILWILKIGARGRDISKTLPSASTCLRRLGDWEEEEVWDDVWRTFIHTLDEQHALDWEECLIDGSFAPAEKWGLCVEKTERGKGTK